MSELQYRYKKETGKPIFSQHGGKPKLPYMKWLESENKKMREVLVQTQSILEQTKIHRKSFNISGGDVFLDVCIDNIKTLTAKETD